MIGSFLGAFVGGVLGAVLWVVVGSWLGAEVGYFAWAIGYFCGFGADWGAGAKRLGILAGLIAMLCACVAVLAGKSAVILVTTARHADAVQAMEVTENDLIATLAKRALREQQQDNVPASPQDNTKDLPVQQRFPDSIWQQAVAEWNALPAAERRQRVELRKQTFAKVKLQAQQSQTVSSLVDTFTLFDLLWFALAAVTAFRVGWGGAEVE